MRISDWSSDVCSSDLNDIDANRDLVLRLMDALNECDVAIIREIIHPDAEWWVLGFGSFDRETLIAQLSDMLGAAKVKETKIIGTTAEGDREIGRASCRERVCK